jgi:hypothetical protein
MGASTTNPCAVDQDIVTTVATVVKSMQNVASIDEIDIYDPCSTSGSCTAATSLCADTVNNINGKYVVGDPVDKYTLQSGTWTLLGTAGYPLNLRTQNHPNELAIGVRILYTFRASAPISFFNYQTSQYATMCLAPSESGA